MDLGLLSSSSSSSFFDALSLTYTSQFVHSFMGSIICLSSFFPPDNWDHFIPDPVLSNVSHFHLSYNMGVKKYWPSCNLCKNLTFVPIGTGHVTMSFNLETLLKVDILESQS